MTTSSPTYTWDFVLAKVPAPTTKEAEIFAVDRPNDELIARGIQIRSEKIITDLLRFSGIIAEFWPKATPAQKKDLLGFSLPLLKVFVHSGKKLADMLGQINAHQDSREADLSAAMAAADQAYKDGMDDRDRLHTALEGVAHLDPTLASRIEDAHGRVKDRHALADSLTALGKIAKEILQNPNAKAAKQLAAGGLDADQIAAFEAAAAHVKTTADKATGARAKGPVSQADLDLQDGICLALMERVMKIFNRAHDRDPSIPRLSPITTRRLFVSGKKPPAEPAPPEAPPGG